MEKTEDLGYINWWEFAPTKDTFIVKTLPDKTKKETESGIIFATAESVVQDRPFKGEVITTGPDSKIAKGSYVYFEPTKGMDLAMIRRDGDEMYILLYDDAILGRRVEDTRN